jgi:cullin 1
MINVEERISALFLPDHMKLSVIQACEKTLITDHKSIFLDRFQDLLATAHHEKLSQVYKVFTRTSLDRYYVIFEKHVRHSGLKAIKAGATPLHAGDPHTQITQEGGEGTLTDRIDPSYFSSIASDVIKHYQNMVTIAFDSDKEFGRSLDRACRDFVNWNSACTYDSDAPNILAKHAGMLLSKGLKGNVMQEAELEEKLADVVCITGQRFRQDSAKSCRRFSLNI